MPFLALDTGFQLTSCYFDDLWLFVLLSLFEYRQCFLVGVLICNMASSIAS